MSTQHHGAEQEKETKEIFKELNLGATGHFPRGKVGSHDEGELRFGVAVDEKKGIIHVDFGKSVAWLGLDVHSALGLAKLLTEGAQKLMRGDKKTE